MQILEIQGFLFDIYNVEEDVHIWILDKEGKPHLLLDHYFPIIYLDGKEIEVRKIIKRLEECIPTGERFLRLPPITPMDTDKRYGF